jgi:hypothetical protein
MITDFAASLSRKRQDKVNGTGRWHIMKNRYGMDGLTYGAKIDTSTGHFEIISDAELEDITPPTSQISNFSNGVSESDKAALRQYQNFFLNT